MQTTSSSRKIGFFPAKIPTQLSLFQNDIMLISQINLDSLPFPTLNTKNFHQWQKIWLACLNSLLDILLSFTQEFLNLYPDLKVSISNFLDEKFKLQLLSQKTTLLTMTDITQSVKSLVQRMLIHCLQVYDSPMKILKILKSQIRNFIQSRDIDKRKLVIVAKSECGKPANEGGLGLRVLVSLNEASNLNFVRICLRDRILGILFLNIQSLDLVEL